jgi:hypothetical protein
MPLYFITVCALLVVIIILDFRHFGQNFEWWTDVFGVATSILTGAIISFIFYYFLVYQPNVERLSIIKKQLHRNLQGYKARYAYLNSVSINQGGEGRSRLGHGIYR